MAPTGDGADVTGATLSGRHIVLGVSGGIAAYKAVDLCRRLMDAGAEVRVVMTADATRFVTPLTFSALSGHPTAVSLWDGPDPIPHTRLGQWADLVLVAPATARSLGAYAAGMSDDLLIATLLATRAPVVVCPAMHTEMWEHPAVQDNLSLLRRRGVVVVEPGTGRLAGGDEGPGRLADAALILAAAGSALANTARPTPKDATAARPDLADAPADAACPAPADRPVPADRATPADALAGAPAAAAPEDATAAAAPEDATAAAAPEDATPAAPEDATPAAPEDATPAAPEDATRAAPEDATPAAPKNATPAASRFDPPHQDLTGRRVLVTAGGTREPIDPVRYLGNRSSGKQGHAVATMAAARGATVTLITTATAAAVDGLPTRGIQTVAVETAEEMEAAVMTHAPSADVIIMAAAVADFRPKAPADHKLKKSDGVPELVLEPTPDILARLARTRRPDQVVVGFAAETAGGDGSELRARAVDKLRRKRLDLVVANDVSAPGVGFGHDTNAVVMVTSEGDSIDVPLADKTVVATAVLNAVVARLPALD